MEYYGCIEPDSEYGKTLGFTSDKFDGYLWREEGENRIMISAIISLDQGKGNLSALFDAIHKQGLAISVPTPLYRMRQILERKGFTKGQEIDEEYPAEYGEVEVWTLEPARPVS